MRDKVGKYFTILQPRKASQEQFPFTADSKSDGFAL